ncbi:MAG TPA: MerR family transcriptional regulator [Candidatus Mediterraneibacter caccavium]|uniref:MerR family transcriptional regulator n=1 Tax=Candidatus Mediterraneibacter caccavium TaxID=2838661 RepID=A0A9D2ARX2_9FIRM|nr:MerR family transcriptional regulator [Candidatus Mediterraneibacter caccavium]
MGEVRFMISEAAKQVDVESHVLRYWEEELGLKIGRTEMGHRYYTDDDIQLFRCIKKLKDEGMLLRELKPLIPELRETRLKIRSEGSRGKTQDPGLSEPQAAATTAPRAEAPAASRIPTQTAPSAPSRTAAPSASLPDAPSVRSESGDVMIPLKNVEQVRALVGDVFREALSENNTVLKKDISSTVTADVVHEMDFLLQAKERQQEEHFRRLDSLIRQQQATRKESAKGSAIMRLRKIFT